MHDAISIERVGTPAVGVMTNKFVSAAALMAKVLGASDYKFAIIDHPVSRASDAELDEKAERVVDLVKDLILRP